MVTWFYFITFAASVVLMGNFIFRNKRVDTGYILFCFMIFFNALGRWLVAASQTVEQALWANKILYFGACYTPFLLIIVLARLSDIKLPVWLRTVLVTYSTVVFGFVMTIGHSGIYYKSVQLAHGNGYNYLMKEYGPLHNLYPIMMVIYIILLLLLLAKAFTKRKSIAFGTVFSIGMLGFVVIVSYLLSRILHSSIEWLSMGYLIAVVIISRLFEHINMYDMTTNIATAVANANENGFIVFDRKKRYVNSNDLIRQMYPEIASWQAEAVPPKSGSFFCDEIIRWFLEYDDIKDHKTVRVSGKYYEISVRDITYGRKERKAGYLLEAADRTAEHNYTAAVEKYNDELAAEVAEKTQNINRIKDKLVLGMASMVESRDNSTGGHINRTSTVISVFAKKLEKHSNELGLTREFLTQVEKAAPMHDLGKIAVDDVILRKNGKFTDEEYSQMKRHSAEGARIVRKILAGAEEDEFVVIAENIAHYHHEKWDGKGYPAGLSGDAIPIEARIMALADVFDALVSKRCYKEAFDYDKAFSIIEESLGNHFDPTLGKIFLECRPELEEIYDELKSAE